MSYEILGVGAPIVDHMVVEEEAFLKEIMGDKGGMHLVDYLTLINILSKSKTPPRKVLGGSCANTVRALAHLGHSGAILGRVGDDDLGKLFLENLKELKIASLLPPSPTPTSQVACIVTPDGERTMRSFIGASAELTIQEITKELFSGVRLVHIEGYQLQNPEIVEHTMKLAKEAGARVSFDLGSFEVVTQYREKIYELIQHYIDILFGNREEVHALTQTSPKEGCAFLKQYCEVVIVLQGTGGCEVGTLERQISCPAYPVEPLDTTGAGDLFASGFLHGYLKQKSLEECAHYGALLGAAVVQCHGVEMAPTVWQKLLSQLKHKD